MRAAFVAVQAGKQVAGLAPTTLLTQQHMENFRDRFADWPIRIESLSRFVSKKEQQRILDDLAAGRLVKPFDLTIAPPFKYYLVCPERRADRPHIAAFRAWIMREAGATNEQTSQGARRGRGRTRT